MQIRNGRKIIKRKRTKAKTKATKDVVVDVATKEEVVVDADAVVKVVDVVKVVETMKDADSTMENIFGNYAQPISTVQLEKLQEPEEAGADEATVEVVVVVVMNHIILMVIHHLRNTMEVQ